MLSSPSSATATGRRSTSLSQIEGHHGAQARGTGQLKRLADHDSLTGFFNRRRFDEELQRELGRLARATPASGATHCSTWTGFKLRERLARPPRRGRCPLRRRPDAARRLRDTDVIARLGGDEFAALLVDLRDVRDAPQIATELAAAIRTQSILTVGGAATVTVSIGVVALDQHTSEREIDTLIAADNAMYRAKRAGRNRISLAA